MFTKLRQRFSPPKAIQEIPQYRIPEGERIYVVGDIHGRSGLLKKMLAAIELDRAVGVYSHVTEVFLGDYIDRGMDSRGVLDLLMQAPAPGTDRICLMGNHEAALLAFLKDPMTLREWANYGGYATLASFGIGIPSRMTAQMLIPVRDQLRTALGSALQFLEGLRYYYQAGDYLFVHAGILPNVTLENQSRATMIRIREPFLSYEPYNPHYVVHGHTPVSSPQLLHNRANLDVSDATLDSLACLVIEGESRRLIEINAKG